MSKGFSGLLRRGRVPAAIGSGVLFACSFPSIGLSGLAWIAPGCIVCAALGTRGWERFRLGYIAGLTHYLCSLYWLLCIPYQWHGLPLGPALGWFALAAFLALFPASWLSILTLRLNETSVVSNGPARAANNSTARSFQGLMNRGLGWRVSWAFAGAMLWVAMEMFIARVFSGFPWNLLGATQHELLPLIQISAITGIYGGSFLIVWVSQALLCATASIVVRPTMRSGWVTEMILPLFGLGCVLVFGFHQLRFEQPRERVLRAALVQPSIPQTLIWDSDKDEERFQSVVALTKTIGPDKVDLLIWPEAAVPKLLRYDPESLDVITNLARSFHAWMIIGADDKEPRAGTLNIHEADYYNSSFLIDPKGRLINRYRKRGLVIFGEYVPLQHTLPFLKYLTPIPGSYTSGDKPVQFDLEDQNIRTAVLICFEDIFPHLAREYVDDDTDLLINLTNNGWFGESASQWQHGLSALFRAIENNVPLIRCSNNGLTCWIDERGRIKQMFRDATDRIYGPGILYATVPLPAHGTHTPTFYHRHGDLFGWVCTGFSALYFLPPMFRFRTAKT